MSRKIKQPNERTYKVKDLVFFTFPPAMSCDASVPSSVVDESRPPIPCLSADLISVSDTTLVAIVKFSGAEVFSVAANNKEEIIQLLRSSVRLIENASAKGRNKRNNTDTTSRSVVEKAFRMTLPYLPSQDE